MKIGIFTFQNAQNYGAMLQAFALKEVLIKMGHEVHIVDYDNPNLGNDYKLFSTTVIEGSILGKVKKTLSNIYFFKKNFIRMKNFSSFKKEYLNLTNKVNKLNYEKSLSDFDAFICGSDQIWNIEITKELDDFYTLNVFQSRYRKISYAASIGDKKILLENKCLFKEKLATLDYVSTREKDIADELSNILKREVSTVLDPTLLLSKEDWEVRMSKKSVNINEKYIFLYVVERENECCEIANYLSEQTGYKIVHCGRRNKVNNLLSNQFCADPFDFLWLIKNAEMVLTTSFHATVFSIIFNRSFYVLPHLKTGTRVLNLLNLLNMSNQVITYETYMNKNYSNVIDYEEVTNLLEKEQKKSLLFLQKAVGIDSYEK